MVVIFLEVLVLDAEGVSRFAKVQRLDRFLTKIDLTIKLVLKKLFHSEEVIVSQHLKFKPYFDLFV